MRWPDSRVIYLSLLVICLALLSTFTGFLQLDLIDDRDLSHWEYSGGIIKGADSFSLEGNSEVCWLLIHSYSATPLEMRVLGDRINLDFGDSVFAVRLKGHGEVPSKILDLSLDDWYLQVENEFEILRSSCEKINVVGSSFGGALATRLAEEKNFHNLYLINSYFSPTYKFYYIFDLNFYLDIFSPLLHYSKKSSIGKINDPVGKSKHIAYWNFVFSPIANSKDFLQLTFMNSEMINENILVQHSINDGVSEVEKTKLFFEKVSSPIKELILFEKSNHIILSDYDSAVAIENIIRFEKNNGVS